MDADKQALMEFMIEKLGGEDTVMLEFRESRIWEAATNDKTLGELFDKAKQDGWLDHIRRLKVSGLVKIVQRNSNGSKPRHMAARAVVARKPERRPRMSPQDKAELRESILAYLTNHPWTGAGAVSKAVGMDTRRLGLHLRQMRYEGLWVSKGENRLTTYAVK